MLTPGDVRRFRRWLLLWLPLLSSAWLIAAPPGPDPARAEVEALMASFRLDSAQVRIQQLASQPYRAYYQGNLLVYWHLGAQDDPSYHRLAAAWDDLVADLEAMPKSDAMRGVMLGELMCKRALVEFLHHHYLSAVNFARLGRKHILKNAEQFPRNLEQNKMLGLFNVVLGAVPSRYQWLTNLLGFVGDLDQGIAQLQQVARHGHLLALEAEVILYHVERNILNQNEQALDRLRQLRARTGNNMLVDYFLATGLMSLKHNEAALQVLLRRPHYDDGAVFLLPFWDYQLGKAYSYQGDLARAKHYLARFVRDYRGNMYRTDANFRLGMVLTLSGAYPAGRPFFQAVADPQGDQFDEDDYARHICEAFARQAPSAALLDLFRARNYYDGGYFERAVAVLLGMNQDRLSPDEQAEWQYRMARVRHTQGHLALAFDHYQRCLDLAVSKPLDYLHAYACYFQAEIAREWGQTAQARAAYRQALQYNHYFYQDGLENRVKAALDGLK